MNTQKFLYVGFILFLTSFQTLSAQEQDKLMMERGATVIADGADVYYRKDGQPDLADFIYKAKDGDLLPEGYRDIDPIKGDAFLEQNPKVSLELKRIQDIFLSRCGNKFLLPPLKEFEIYFTEDLVGFDQVSIEKGVTFQRLAETFTSQKTKIIGIMPSIFAQLDPRRKALTLVHELLHHQELLGHKVISPLIHNLFDVLALMDRQEKFSPEKLPLISIDEKDASLDLQKYLESYSACDAEGLVINLNGGGVVYGSSLFKTRNYVSASSTVFAELKYDAIPDGNVFHEVTMQLKAKDGTCRNNIFHRIPNKAIVRCQGKNNELKNVRYDGPSKDSPGFSMRGDFDYEKMAEIDLPSYFRQIIEWERQNVSLWEVILNGDYIQLDDVTYGISMVLEGRNRIENVKCADVPFYFSSGVSVLDSQFLAARGYKSAVYFYSPDSEEREVRNWNLEVAGKTLIKVGESIVFDPEKIYNFSFRRGGEIVFPKRMRIGSSPFRTLDQKFKVIWNLDLRSPSQFENQYRDYFINQSYRDLLE